MARNSSINDDSSLVAGGLSQGSSWVPFRNSSSSSRSLSSRLDRIIVVLLIFGGSNQQAPPVKVSLLVSGIEIDEVAREPSRRQGADLGVNKVRKLRDLDRVPMKGRISGRGYSDLHVSFGCPEQGCFRGAEKGSECLLRLDLPVVQDEGEVNPSRW
jgi:hypothetical protein